MKKDSYSPAEIKELLRKAGSRYVGEQIEAERAALELGDQVTEALLEFLQEDEKRIQRNRRACKGILIAVSVIIPLLVIALIVSGNAHFLGVLGTFGALGALSGAVAPSQHRLAALTLLAQTEDVRVAGYFVEALGGAMFPQTRGIAARVAMRLLPRLKPEDARFFTSRQRAALLRLLRTGEKNKETELLLAVMEGVTRLEEAQALPLLKAYCDGNAATEGERALKERAESLYPILAAVAQRAEGDSNLLRAAMPSVSGDYLLRPAQGGKEEQAESLLLRASESETPEDLV